MPEPSIITDSYIAELAAHMTPEEARDILDAADERRSHSVGCNMAVEICHICSALERETFLEAEFRAALVEAALLVQAGTSFPSGGQASER